MDLVALFAEYGAWSWVVVGLVLLALELVAPGGVFLWLGISAIVTGILTLRYPLDWAVQFGFFGVLALVTIFGWLRLMRGRRNVTDAPYLNDRAARFVGQEAVLEEAITSGSGRLPLGDSVWRIEGPDLPAGRRVKIVGYDGPVLHVVAV